MQLEFEGLDELIAEFEKMEYSADKYKDEALIVGADILLKNMQAEVYRNGLTRRSGNAEKSLTRTEPKNDEIFVGTRGGKKQSGYYLYMHEFGFYNVRAGRFIAPRPFASIAYENSKNKILSEQAKVLRKGLGI
jgi:HK97 gp10 family phage protein